VLLDNLANSQVSVVERIGEITGTVPVFVEGDIRDTAAVADLLRAEDCEAVMHFAALKSVEQSVAQPLVYYENNVGGTRALLEAMSRAGVRSLVFSSSATVYGDPETLPLREDSPLGDPANPYGATKLFCERILLDLFRSDPSWSLVMLRYFNPVGAHPSGLIGEEPRGEPTNLMPLLTQVAAGLRPVLRVFGDDYPTRDGTPIRDYIHVMDVAEGHAAALTLADQPGAWVYNLGTGVGSTVLEVLETFRSATGIDVPYQIGPRRPGDVAATWADCSKAESELGWKARLDLGDMCTDAWRWQQQLATGTA
jgi:UDP-glucose 4-epimerase